MEAIVIKVADKEQHIVLLESGNVTTIELIGSVYLSTYYQIKLSALMSTKEITINLKNCIKYTKVWKENTFDKKFIDDAIDYWIGYHEGNSVEFLEVSMPVETILHKLKWWNPMMDLSNM